MFHAITPVLLTFNERPNIGRTLSHLDWADEIVVVDSGSNDGTLDVLRQNPKVRVYERKFDTHAGQWRYAITETNISTPWILRLDADYQISPGVDSGNFIAGAHGSNFRIPDFVCLRDLRPRSSRLAVPAKYRPLSKGSR